MPKSQKEGAEASLAAFLANLKSIETQKLNVVGKGLVKIGNAIPPQYKDTKVLYLSRNNLKTLDNVQQFTNLRAFSAADNFLPDFSSIASLHELTALEALSLEGNPLTDLPNYRYRMILMQANSPLHQLDGKPVTLEDRAIAAAVCGIEDTVINLTVKTTCLVNSFYRAHQMIDLHREMYIKMWQREAKAGTSQIHRQQCIARLVSRFEEERLSLEAETTIDASNKDIVKEIEAKAVAWNGKALRKAAAGGAKLNSSVAWHAAFCRILADKIAKLEDVVRFTAASDSTDIEYTATHDIASILVSLRQALQQLSKLKPGCDTLDQAKELEKGILELQFNLVQHLMAKDNEGTRICDSTFSISWVIQAARTHSDASPPLSGVLRPTTLSLTSPTTGSKEKCSLDMSTLAAQHVIATESVAKLELSLKDAKAQAAKLNEKLTLTALKLDSAEAENQLLRQEQVAAKEANAALQHWLENANNETEAAKKQVEAQTEELNQAREMHAVEVSHLESQIKALKQQVEDTESILRADAWDHEQALYTSKLESEMLQGEKRHLKRRLEETLLAAEAAKSQMQPIKLEINVFLARELELEKARNAQLQEQAVEMAVRLDSVLKLQREQADAAEAILLGKAARKAELERLEEYELALQARRIAAAGLKAWRLATQRLKKLDSLSHQKRQRVRFQLFFVWNRYTKSTSLLCTLNTAAVEAAKVSLTRKMFATWRSTSASLKLQVVAELPRNDPRVHHAAELFHRKYHISPFQAWRSLAHAQSTQNEAIVVLSVAQREATILKDAFTMWRDTAAMQREESNEILCGIAARNVVLGRQILKAWQMATRNATVTRVAEATAARAAKRILLAKALASWVDYRNKIAEEANKLANEVQILQNMEECEALEAQQRELALQAAVDKAEDRARVASLALQRQIFSTWRTEVVYNKHIDAISTWCASSTRRQLLLRSLGGWRAAVFSDQVEELAHEKGQIEASLRAASSEIASKEQEVEAMNDLRLQGLSRVENLEDNVAQLKGQLSTAAHHAALLEEQLQQAEDAKLAAEEFEEQAVLGAEAAVETEQHARRAAELACQQAQQERDNALSSALLSQSEATAALEACRMAEQRAQNAEESRVEAEIVAIDALESVEAAASACERLAEECAGLHIALNEANQRYTALKERHTIATETVDSLKQSEELYLDEQIKLKQQLKAVQQRCKEAEHDKEVAESDAHVAMRQSQRLAEILEQHVQHQEHPLALIYQ